MSDTIDNAREALNSLATAVRDGWTGNQTLMEAWGWNCPALDRHDLARLAQDVSDRFGQIDPDDIDEDLGDLIDEIPGKCTKFRGATLAYLYNGNAAGAFPAYKGLLDWCDSLIRDLIPADVDWESVDDQKLVPKSLNRRLRSAAASVEGVESRVGNLATKIQAIEDAHESAEALPTDLASLEEARKQAESATKQAQSFEKRSKDAAEQAEGAVKSLIQKHNDAEKIVSSLEDAYSAATTKGLGESFSERAKRLAISMWVWVAVLVGSLAGGAVLSLVRLAALKKVLETATPNIGLVWVNIVLGVLSIAGPVWLAWVATKQIGQRFRLSEDYAFKASVAKAYEGYRREAARIDEKFAKQLFESALSRLDEAPLRYVEHETYGSPWHEMTATKAGQRPSIMANTVARFRKPRRHKPDDASHSAEDAGEQD